MAKRMSKADRDKENAKKIVRMGHVLKKDNRSGSYWLCGSVIPEAIAESVIYQMGLEKQDDGPFSIWRARNDRQEARPAGGEPGRLLDDA